MPGHVEKGGGDCAADKWAVIWGGQTAGCHDTEEKAKKQLAALYANEKGKTIVEHRSLQSREVRVPDDGSRTFEAVVVTYGVEDDYHTIFDAGCFAASLNDRLPKITWAHNWSEPLGRYVDYRDTETELVLVGEFDDFESVPRARQAWAQLRSGTIDQFSVGFARDRIEEDEEGRIHFKKARLDEAALVLAAAVPGTKLLQVRSSDQSIQDVPIDTVVELAKKVAAGELTNDEAKAGLALTLPPTSPPPPDTTPAAEAEADAVLATDPDDPFAVLDQLKEQNP